MQAHDMDVFFLNLETAVARREEFVAQYEAFDYAPHWQLHRFHAIDAQHPLVRNAAGDLCDGNKGCFFSSLECIREAFDSGKHLFIVDDDIDFAGLTQYFVDAAISRLAEDDWDILLTDTIIPNAFDMPFMTMLWHELRQEKSVRTMNLADARFSFCAGSTITNRKSKRKIHELMMRHEFSQPWDLVMREHIEKGRVKAYLIVPYITTVGKRADESQIRPNDPAGVEHRLCNEFRRMMWIGECFADKTDAYFSEWATKAHRDLIIDEVVRLNSILAPLLSLQLSQRWHLRGHAPKKVTSGANSLE